MVFDTRGAPTNGECIYNIPNIAFEKIFQQKAITKISKSPHAYNIDFIHICDTEKGR